MEAEYKPGSANPVKKPGHVSMKHVLLSLHETEEERDSRIRSLFEFFDAVDVGFLDHAQIEKGLSALKIPAKYKYANELLRVCDANSDVRVDYQEFKKYMDDKELQLYAIFQAVNVEHSVFILPEEFWDALVKSVGTDEHESNGDLKRKQVDIAINLLLAAVKQSKRHKLDWNVLRPPNPNR